MLGVLYVASVSATASASAAATAVAVGRFCGDCATAGTMSTVWKNPHKNVPRDRNKTGLFRDRFRCMLKSCFSTRRIGPRSHLRCVRLDGAKSGADPFLKSSSPTAETKVEADFCDALSLLNVGNDWLSRNDESMISGAKVVVIVFDEAAGARVRYSLCACRAARRPDRHGR
jgi:hypothetical protein